MLWVWVCETSGACLLALCVAAFGFVDTVGRNRAPSADRTSAGEQDMPIIAIATTKGGSGKTTLAAGLAAYWSQQGKSVVALDTDNNRNLKGRLTGSVIDCREVDEEAIRSAAKEAAASAEMVIIDVAGALTRGLLYAVSAASVVAIPCKADRNDVLEAARTQDVIRQAEDMTGRLIPHGAILTQINRRAQVTTITRGQLDALGVPCLSEELPMRAAYQYASYTGSPLADPMVYEDIAAIAAALSRLMSRAHG